MGENLAAAIFRRSSGLSAASLRRAPAAERSTMNEPNYYIPPRGFTIPIGDGFTIY